MRTKERERQTDRQRGILTDRLTHEKEERDRQTYRQRVRLTVRLRHGKEERDRQTHWKKRGDEREIQCETYHCRLSSRKKKKKKKNKKKESQNERKGHLDDVPDTLVIADNGELIPSSILDNISTPVNYVVSFTRKIILWG